MIDMATKKRPRTLRRELERERNKLAKVRESLAALEPGGAPERPIEVESASQVEPHTRSMHCPICEDSYRVLDHEVATGPHGMLRVVTAQSPQCGRTTKIWFVLRPTLPN
jgi:hypothetical protein